ncbi:MAG TPA: SagB/ThcOx family dehydrogenase [Thermodesulfobacteriota bacterium]|nr:SagB/ThcOx family dehydrogenase [Thermodesulfobacteriota bacterium]
MKRYFPMFDLVLVCGLAILMFLPLCMMGHSALAQGKSSGESIKLPPPKYESDVSVEKALLERRSIRSYKEEPLTLNELSQILWAAQGITEPTKGLRTAPSPRAVYLLQLYVLPGNVANLPMGIYKYQPQTHDLIKIADGDKKAELFKAAGQAPIKNAPVALVITGLSEKTQNPAWMYLEAGHAAENIYLQSVSLKLGTVAMAGFKEDDVRKALNLPDKERVIYIMPIGKK